MAKGRITCCGESRHAKFLCRCFLLYRPGVSCPVDQNKHHLDSKFLPDIFSRGKAAGQKQTVLARLDTLSSRSYGSYVFQGRFRHSQNNDRDFFGSFYVRYVGGLYPIGQNRIQGYRFPSWILGDKHIHNGGSFYTHNFIR